MPKAAVEATEVRSWDAACGSDAALPTVADVCEAPDEFLGKLDIAAINLICASGLPGGEVYNIASLLDWIDDAARKVRVAIDANSQKFIDSPAAFDHSYARFSILYLITVLQRECGVRYNPKWQALAPRAPVPKEFGKSANDGFIHAIINGIGGTCGSLPVIYVAVGRRLGYPLRLVKAYRHLFVRWDDPQGKLWFHADRFNIEATGPGVHFLPDAHYRNWPAPIVDADVRDGIYLKSLTPREELAEFVATRGYCLQANGRLIEAADTLRCASQLAPANRYFSESHRVLSIHIAMRRRGHAFLNASVPPPFDNHDWPAGVHCVRGEFGKTILIQVPRDPFAPVSAGEALSRGDRNDGAALHWHGSLTRHLVQSPSGQTVEVEIPEYDWHKPMRAEWVQLPGGHHALLHFELVGQTHATSRNSHLREWNRGPVLPAASTGKRHRATASMNHLCQGCSRPTEMRRSGCCIGW
ncbi:MAG TPA: hypothetical protein VHZ24_13525 [Pirellulales bacterium]|nr:hypothetical protein [Pirellulales bacterium]